VDLASLRDLRDYGDSTTAGRVIRQSREALLGQDIGIETQRTFSTAVSLVPSLVAWARPRVQLSSSFSLARDPNARQLARVAADTAGAFRLPTAFSNTRRSEGGVQVDVRRLGEAVFGDGATLARVLGRITAVDLRVGRTVTSSFNRSAVTPTLEYQLGLGGLDRMRSEGGRLAASASENTVLNAQTGAVLPLGLRFTTAYQRTRTESWLLRGAEQVPIYAWSRDWPSLSAAWTLSLPPAGPGRLLRGLTAQLSYRERETHSEQVGLAGAGGGVTRRASTDRAVSPSLTLTWAGGVVTSLDAADTRTEQLTAGSLFRATRGTRNLNVSFLVRPLSRLLGLPAPVRGNGRYSTNRNEVCLRSAGQQACVPYADTRQTQAEFTLATDIPPNISAGFQMAYVLNEERQTNRKNSQLVFTAFVTMTTSVGQLR
jgi:hypothetical protein